MNRSPIAHALLTLVSRHMVVWSPGSWGPTGWRRVDGIGVDSNAKVLLRELNLAGLVAIDAQRPACKYYTPRPARLTDDGEATLQRWDRLKVRVE